MFAATNYFAGIKGNYGFNTNCFNLCLLTRKPEFSKVEQEVNEDLIWISNIPLYRTEGNA